MSPYETADSVPLYLTNSRKMPHDKLAFEPLMSHPTFLFLAADSALKTLVIDYGLKLFHRTQINGRRKPPENTQYNTEPQLTRDKRTVRAAGAAAAAKVLITLGKHTS